MVAKYLFAVGDKLRDIFYIAGICWETFSLHTLLPL